MTDLLKGIYIPKFSDTEMIYGDRIVGVDVHTCMYRRSAAESRFLSTCSHFSRSIEWLDKKRTKFNLFP